VLTVNKNTMKLERARCAAGKDREVGLTRWWLRLRRLLCFRQHVTTTRPKVHFGSYLNEPWSYRGYAIEWCHANFSPSDPRCHGNKIWDIMG